MPTFLLWQVWHLHEGFSVVIRLASLKHRALTRQPGWLCLKTRRSYYSAPVEHHRHSESFLEPRLGRSWLMSRLENVSVYRTNLGRQGQVPINTIAKNSDLCRDLPISASSVPASGGTQPTYFSPSTNIKCSVPQAGKFVV